MSDHDLQLDGGSVDSGGVGEAGRLARDHGRGESLPADLELPEDWGALVEAGARRYDLLALDLDGTLFDGAGRVPEENVAAIEAARCSGMEVVICTGRGFRESRRAVEAIGAFRPASGRREAPVVNAGGAMVTDASTGSTMHRWPMRDGLVREICGHFASLGRAPLLLKDRGAAGVDYLVVESGPIEGPSRWWFDNMDVAVSFVDSVEDDPHPEHTVRVGFAAMTSEMLELSASVGDAFGDRVMMQHFAAVSAVKGEDGTERDLGAKDERVQLLEMFDRRVSKWTAIRHVAAEHGIPRERIAAIGDEINDRAMIEGASLGIAMGNAVAEIRDLGNAITRRNDEAGVAWAIAAMLRGDW